MRKVDVNDIAKAVSKLVVSANRELNSDIVCALDKAIQTETHAPAKALLEILRENANIARTQRMPICQDTGMAIVFADVGQEVHLTGGLLEDAINQGVSMGYTEGLLRKSIVADPLNRINTGDNTPAVIHTRIIPGDKVNILVAPKGFGSENMSQIKMLSPSDGLEGVKQFVIDTVIKAGSNPCPPIVVGVGIGGSFEKAALMAKQALTLPVDEQHPDPYYSQLEKELLNSINETGVGAQGFGGKITALGLRILTYPTHIAGLPVAVNISCHVTRHAQATL